MNRYRRGLAVIGVLVLLPAFSPAASRPVRPRPVRQDGPAVPAPDASFEETARFLSGLPCASEDARRLQETPAIKEFMAAMDKSWAGLEAGRLKPMREWAAAELAAARPATKTLFYPFGGPDFLTAFELFPDAETFVLLGLEFVGRLPDVAAFTPARAAGYARAVQAALSDFFKKSYFITHNMDATLGRDQVDGVLPVLCLFLERTGNRILAVKRCLFLDTGEMLEGAFTVPARRRRPYGVKIEFQPGAGGPAKSLYYFSCDLADAAFKVESALYKLLDATPYETTFVKSASYLMHYTTFTQIRNLVLTKSRYVLQDDTGIPYRYFKPETWLTRLYGEYVKPVKDFSGVEQEDLKAAYADPASDVRKLPFHLGYHWGSNKDSYQYFERKDGADAGAQR
jgi:hypothetical protein